MGKLKPLVTDEEVKLLKVFTAEQERGLVHSTMWVRRMASLRQGYESDEHQKWLKDQERKNTQQNTDRAEI